MSNNGVSTQGLRRVIVFGAGALGSLLGGRLSSRLPVVLVTRGAHLAAIRERGLRLGGLADRHCLHGENVTAIQRLDELTQPLQPGELILLTVKALQVKEAGLALAEVLRRMGAPRVVVLALQNGTGFEDDLRTALRDLAEVRFGVAFAGATMKEPGVVEDWGGEVLVPCGPPFEALAAAWTTSGQPAKALAEVEVRRWEKILLNCFLNAFSALLNARNCETIRPEWRPLRRAILREGRAAAATQGLAMPHEDTLLESYERRSLGSRNVNSMLQDIQRGRPTEIEFLNGAMVRLSLGHGDQAPANAMVAEWVRKLEKTPAGSLEHLRRQAVTDLLAGKWD
jgi:2-dehydropantoate 2-reductase